MSAEPKPFTGEANSDAQHPETPIDPVAETETVDEPETDAATELAQRIVGALAEIGPPGWQELEATIAVTVAAEAGFVTYSDGDRSMRAETPQPVLRLAREQRAAVVRAGDEPWLRLLIRAVAPATAGAAVRAVEIEFDNGDEPFPAEQLFAPEVYLADLQEHPRRRLPMWLAAYVSHGDRQVRTPQQAAARARADKAAGVWAVLADNEFPPFPVLWARWATLAAAFVAVGSEWGPRVLPAGGVFESSKRGGSTLYVLPGQRAVLSGGVWDAPALAAAYDAGADLPNLYAGAPDWVTNEVLNPRASAGLLSFCYWWEHDRWYRGESPTAADCASAVPGVWSAKAVAGIIVSLLGPRADAQSQTAADTLVAAAEVGVATRETVVNVFGDDVDIDGALHQLSLAGLVAETVTPIDAAEAVDRVRHYVSSRDLDTTGYPLSELVADRFSCGWTVYVPVPEGEVAIGRAIFYVGDDGVLEQSSSSIESDRYIAGFEQRFRQRQGL
ncbi:hypothetical protein [Nocardia arthritidis]|uniref:hypothetical protein n=1 Tax=Nocardia arthritidis TaxID=228602 RepID=UPI001EEBD3CC|nr:hypothetical protein [Nocardia arthritidis]